MRHATISNHTIPSAFESDPGTATPSAFESDPGTHLSLTPERLHQAHLSLTPERKQRRNHRFLGRDTAAELS